MADDVSNDVSDLSTIRDPSISGWANKKLGKKMLKVLATALLAITAATTSQGAERSLSADRAGFQYSWEGQMTVGNDGNSYRGLCIGGEICGWLGVYLSVYYPSVYVKKVIVTADDNVGDKHKAELELWVNGKYVSKQDVRASGSTLYFDVNKTVMSIELKSVMNTGNPKGDETLIHEYQSY